LVKRHLTASRGLPIRQRYPSPPDFGDLVENEGIKGVIALHGEVLEGTAGQGTLVCYFFKVAESNE
jgi:hypothetical protein